MITLRVVNDSDQKKTITADGESVFPVLQKIPPCTNKQGQIFGITFGLLLFKEFPDGKYFLADGHTSYSVYVRAEDVADFLEYESRLGESSAIFGLEQIGILNEYVAFFEAQEGANAEALREFLSQSVGEFGFKLRAWGSEKTMRLMLIDRANFIENSASNNKD